MKIWPAKDPAEVLDYTWTVPLDTGDTIASATATVTSGTAVKDSQSNTDSILTLWLSGGAADELNYVSLTATTNGGRTHREAGVLPVIDRAAETLALFRMRYPAFVAIDDGLIGYWLTDAGALVGDSWAEASRVPARIAYAAHKLVETGALSGAVPAGLTSFKSGTFSATVSNETASLTGLDATLYGREFLKLRRATFAGPRLAWTPPVADCA